MLGCLGMSIKSAQASLLEILRDAEPTCIVLFGLHSLSVQSFLGKMYQRTSNKTHFVQLFFRVVSDLDLTARRQESNAASFTGSTRTSLLQPQRTPTQHGTAWTTSVQMSLHQPLFRVRMSTCTPVAFSNSPKTVGCGQLPTMVAFGALSVGRDGCCTWSSLSLVKQDHPVFEGKKISDEQWNIHRFFAVSLAR